VRYVDYKDKLGCLYSALLLSQIVYWCGEDEKSSKLRIKFNGQLYLVKSRVALREETALSEWQLRVALQTLKDQKLIVVEIHLFCAKGSSMPSRHYFIQLDRVALQRLNTVASSTSQVVDSSTSHVEATSTSYIHQTTAEDYVTIKTATVVAAPAGEGNNIPSQPGKEKTNTGENMDLKEILAVQQAKKPITLEGLWKKRLGLYQPGFVHPFTAKEQGQMKQLRAKCGVDTWAVVEYVLEHWHKFGQQAKANLGVSSYPAIPQVGFVLLGWQTALQLIAGGAEPTAGLSLAKESVLSYKKGEVVVHTPEQGLTPEEIAADMALFDPPPG
jgi:hypothetical protein